MIVSSQGSVRNGFGRPETDRFRGRLGELSPEQEQVLDAADARHRQKNPATCPLARWKTAARDPQSTTVSDLVRRMFKLDDNYGKTAGFRFWVGRRQLNARICVLALAARNSLLMAVQPHRCAAAAQGHTVNIQIIQTTGDKIYRCGGWRRSVRGMLPRKIEEALAEGRGV